MAQLDSENGCAYKSVEYSQPIKDKSKKGKIVKVISNGMPYKK